MLQKREDRQRKRHIRKGGEAKKVHCLEGSLSNPLGAQQRGIEIGDFDSPLNKNLNAKNCDYLPLMYFCNFNMEFSSI